MKTQTVSPTDLAIGDKVFVHGAIVEVAHVRETGFATLAGGQAVSCMARLVGDDMGAIPRAYFQTPAELTRAGCIWSHELPDGLYWNVQGNGLARVAKVIDA